MTVFRLKVLEAFLACIFAVGALLWSYFAMVDRFVWVLEYALVPGLGFLFFAAMQYWDERKILRRKANSITGMDRRPDWFNLGIVTFSGIAMANLFAWVGVENRSSEYFIAPALK